MTIEQRISNARKRNEYTLNLAFPIRSVRRLCKRLKIDSKVNTTGDLVNKIRRELE